MIYIPHPSRDAHPLGTTSSLLESARIVDVTPTVLYQVGLPAPDHLDGRAPTAAVHPSHLQKKHTVQRVQATEQTVSPDPTGEFTDRQLADVWGRVRGLGYVSST